MFVKQPQKTNFHGQPRLPVKKNSTISRNIFKGMSINHFSTDDDPFVSQHILIAADADEKLKKHPSCFLSVFLV